MSQTQNGDGGAQEVMMPSITVLESQQVPAEDGEDEEDEVPAGQQNPCGLDEVEQASPAGDEEEMKIGGDEE